MLARLVKKRRKPPDPSPSIQQSTVDANTGAKYGATLVEDAAEEQTGGKPQEEPEEKTQERSQEELKALIKEKPIRDKPAEENPIREKPIQCKGIEEKSAEKEPTDEEPMEEEPGNEKRIEEESGDEETVEEKSAEVEEVEARKEEEKTIERKPIPMAPSVMTGGREATISPELYEQQIDQIGEAATDNATMILDVTATRPEEVHDENTTTDPEKVLAVIIHGTDRIKSKMYITHPMVKVHIVNGENGEYARKSYKYRPVVYANEVSMNRPDQIDYILPLMTKPSDFRRKGLSSPSWEELLLFNEDFHHFIEPSNKILLLFEILDFKSMTAIKRDISSAETAPIQTGDAPSAPDAWYCVAWAFLKLVGSNGAPNTGSHLRLQMYKPVNKRKPRDGRQPEIYQWWKHGPRVKYAGTLFVTVKPVDRPLHVPSASRSFYAVQKEEVSGKESGHTLAPDEATEEDTTVTSGAVEPPYQWTRLPGQHCKVPNKLSATLFCGRGGCFRLKFSSNGRYFAAAGADVRVNKFPIYVYGYPSNNVCGILYGHLQLVYELSWNSADLLLSASGDCTARLWDVTHLRCCSVLAHTTFVYCARFHPIDDQLVFTGAFDKRIRLWSLKLDRSKPRVIQEFEPQSSYINCFCFTSDHRYLYSGDGAGCICIWAPADQTGECWMFLKELKESRLTGKPINTMEVHPDQKRLLIQTRDGGLQALELRSLALRGHYHGLRNAAAHLKGDLSPCGTMYFAGDGDGRAIVWHLQSGQILAEYNDLSMVQFPVACVSYHPFDHTVAFGVYGSVQPILVYTYNAAVPELCTEQPIEIKPEKHEGPTFDPDYSLAKLLEEHRLLTKLDLPTAEWLKKRGKAVSIAATGTRVGAKMSKTSSDAPEAVVMAPKRVSFGHVVHHPESPQKRRQAFAERDSQQSTLMEIPIGECVQETQDAKKHDSVVAMVAERKTSANKDEINNAPVNVIPILHSNVEAIAPAVIGEVKAKFNYKAQNDDEISFTKGDVIKIVKRDEQWWVGYVSEDKIGYFPSNYVTDIS